MKASELRIGNWINSPSDKKDIQVDGCDIFMLENNHWRKILFNPISLTEELLLKFGFEKHERNPFWFRRGNFMISLVGVVEIMNELGAIVKVSEEIKYIHQLQNLYFALKCEELQLK